MLSHMPIPLAAKGIAGSLVSGGLFARIIKGLALQRFASRRRLRGRSGTRQTKEQRRIGKPIASGVMTASRHLIALLKSHIDGDDEHFLSVAMQVAAHEARQGHGKLAQELRELVDEARQRGKERGSKPVPLTQPKGELASLVSVSYSDTRLSSMVLPAELEERLKRVLTEQRQQHRLRNHGLMPRRKLLLLGPPGSGKTMTAAALAGELKVPLFTVVFDSLISKFMGETASKLRIVFDAMMTTRGVYFFDEFDAIGSKRGERNDVGEIRRVLNSFLQLLEKDDSDGLIIAATNHPELSRTLPPLRRRDPLCAAGQQYCRAHPEESPVAL